MHANVPIPSKGGTNGPLHLQVPPGPFPTSKQALQTFPPTQVMVSGGGAIGGGGGAPGHCEALDAHKNPRLAEGSGQQTGNGSQKIQVSPCVSLQIVAVSGIQALLRGHSCSPGLQMTGGGCVGGGTTGPTGPIVNWDTGTSHAEPVTESRTLFSNLDPEKYST